LHIGEQEAVIWDLLHYRWRVGIDNDLPKRVICPHLVFYVCGNVPQQVNHGWDPRRVNTVLRFLKTEHAL